MRLSGSRTIQKTLLCTIGSSTQDGDIKPKFIMFSTFVISNACAYILFMGIYLRPSLLLWSFLHHQAFQPLSTGKPVELDSTVALVLVVATTPMHGKDLPFFGTNCSFKAAHRILILTQSSQSLITSPSRLLPLPHLPPPRHLLLLPLATTNMARAQPGSYPR
jgi:hypothetical protein